MAPFTTVPLLRTEAASSCLTFFHSSNDRKRSPDESEELSLTMASKSVELKYIDDSEEVAMEDGPESSSGISKLAIGRRLVADVVVTMLKSSGDSVIEAVRPLSVLSDVLIDLAKISNSDVRHVEQWLLDCTDAWMLKSIAI